MKFRERTPDSTPEPKSRNWDSLRKACYQATGSFNNGCFKSLPPERRRHASPWPIDFIPAQRHGCDIQPSKVSRGYPRSFKIGRSMFRFWAKRDISSRMRDTSVKGTICGAGRETLSHRSDRR